MSPRQQTSIGAKFCGIALIAFSLGVGWALITPLFHAPDEAEHYDLISALAASATYPTYNGRATNPTIDALAREVLNSGGGSRSPKLGGKSPPAALTTANLSDPVRFPERAASNQMPQHPPLYYVFMSGALRTIRWIDPGPRAPSIATEVLLLRLINAAMVSSVPVAAGVALTRLSGGARSGVSASLMCLAVPQFYHIAGSINNDNLLNVVGAWSIVWSIQVAQSGITMKRGAVGGVLGGLALATKAFGIFVVAAMFSALILAAFRSAPWRTLIRPGSAFLSPLVVIGAPFWVWTFARTGQVAPTTFFERAPIRPAASRPDHAAWLLKALEVLPQRFWLAAGRYSATIDLRLSALLSGVSSATCAVGLLRLRRMHRLAVGVIAMMPSLLAGGYVVYHAHEIYVRTTWTSFLQGRYLFVGMAGLAAVGAMAFAIRISATSRRVGLLVVSALNGLAFWIGLRAFWSSPTGHGGVSSSFRTVASWSPLDGRVLAVCLVLLVGLAAASGAMIVSDSRRDIGFRTMA